MKIKKRFWLGLVLGLALTPPLAAQAPALPAAAPAAAAPGGALGGAAAVGAPGAAPAAAPPAGNLLGFLCPTPAQCAQIKLCFCNSIFGKMFTSMMAPMSALSGGLLQSCCPAVQTAADLAMPADSPEGAAARIKADEAAAKARRADVRYLGTVDCRRWPEAEDALINALRADRNECVRLEAAWALGRGCCCTRRTLEALSLSASGSIRDGHPRECSARVRGAAYASLNHCLAGLAQPIEGVPPPPPEVGPKELPKEIGKTPAKPPVTPAAYYKDLDKQPMKTVVESARQTLGKSPPVPTQPTPVPRQSKGGLLDIVMNAYTVTHPRSDTSPAGAKVMELPQPTPTSAPGSNVQIVTHIEPVPATLSYPVMLGAPVSPFAETPVMPAAPVSPFAATPTHPATVPVKVVEFRPTQTTQCSPTTTQAPQSAPTTTPAPQSPPITPPFMRPSLFGGRCAGRVQVPCGPPQEIYQLIGQLQHGLSDQERERAAEALAASMWCGHPDVLAALTTAGRSDPFPAVRATCLRCVARINFNKLPQ